MSVSSLVANDIGATPMLSKEHLRDTDAVARAAAESGRGGPVRLLCVFVIVCEN